VEKSQVFEVVDLPDPAWNRGGRKTQNIFGPPALGRSSTLKFLKTERERKMSLKRIVARHERKKPERIIEKGGSI